MAKSSANEKSQDNVYQWEVISEESNNNSKKSQKKSSHKWVNADQIKRSVYDFYQEYGHLVLWSIFAAIALWMLWEIALGIFFWLLGVLFITGYFRDE
jgi:hypothetical protein